MRSLRLQSLDVQPARQRVELQSAIECARRGETIPLEQFKALTRPELGRVDMHKPTFNAGIKRDAEKRMAHMDALPADVREVAHDLGFTVVHAFFTAGIKKAKTIRHLICLSRGQQVDGRPAAFGNHRVGSRQ